MKKNKTEQHKGKLTPNAVLNEVGGAVHYAPSGEWGGEKVNCGRYFTTDVAWSGTISKVTCKYCVKNIYRAVSNIIELGLAVTANFI